MKMSYLLQDGLAPSPYLSKEVQVRDISARDRDFDKIAIEEPLEIRCNGLPLVITMRTPGHDEELVKGFCISEGIQVIDLKFSDYLASNIIEVSAMNFNSTSLQRYSFMSSACGICGKKTIEEIRQHLPAIVLSDKVSYEVILRLPDTMRNYQAGFNSTGGLHGVSLFTLDGDLLCVREDVGRHNAMDKVVGWASMRDMLPLRSYILCVSGRISFELVQKAIAAGCPFIVGVGSPSSLALELASSYDVTVCGFVRDGKGVVYSGFDNIILA
ncbi:MAG: formate dehydrogenase accessory sulfurtransferase FdhD [Actinobacteria bacterium]|jgi:FdhD protein|nr:formate dehydrogenase accessory sulfurtransferase FdhD [Actinomycetota bacterium]MCL6095164.1 formate dehydrogenase accessory sulfurtransferase FdhD [Actinomycetota bacterium]